MPVHPSSPPRSYLAGRFLLAATGLLTAAVGGLFVWLLADSYRQAHAMRHWPEIPCTILLSTIEERQHDPHSPREYRHKVLFGYEIHNQALTSDLPSLRGSRWTNKQARAVDDRRKHPVGASTTCRVNPADPRVAVLKADSLAPGYTLWFPLLFVIGGLGITLRALCPAKKSR